LELKINLKVLDLFSGIGGLTLGFENVGYETLLALDFDHNIKKTFQSNFRKIEFINDDIRKIDLVKILQSKNLIDNIDMIVGGPPCQGYSMANRKRITHDPRNMLFMEFYKAVKNLKPKCFLIENVSGFNNKNIKLDNKLETVSNTMVNLFNEINYEIKFLTFEAQNLGVPQLRKRVLVIGTNLDDKKVNLKNNKIGYLEDTSYYNHETKNKKNQFDFFTNNLPKTPNVWDALSDLPIIEAGENGNEKSYISSPKNDFQEYLRSNSNNVKNHVSTPHSQDAISRMSMIKQGQNFRDLPSQLQTKSVHSGAWGRLETRGYSPTITTRFDTPSVGRVIHPFQNRTITVREAARLQSFPDNFIFYGTRTSQGKQVGNAVPPLVAKSIGLMFKKQFFK